MSLTTKRRRWRNASVAPHKAYRPRSPREAGDSPLHRRRDCFVFRHNRADFAQAQAEPGLRRGPRERQKQSQGLAAALPVREGPARQRHDVDLAGQAGTAADKFESALGSQVFSSTDSESNSELINGRSAVNDPLLTEGY